MTMRVGLSSFLIGLFALTASALAAGPGRTIVTTDNSDYFGFDLRSEPVPAAGTVAANLLAPLLLQWARRGDELPARIIASGLLESEGDAVAAAFGERGLVERERRSGGGWVALVLERALP